MKFRAKISDGCGDDWWEDFEEITTTPFEFVCKIIEDYNKSGRSKSKRSVIGVRIIDRADRVPHNWEKSNLVTLQDKFGTYDSRKCKICGITGKVRSIAGNVIIDKKFKNCDPVFCK